VDARLVVSAWLGRSDHPKSALVAAAEINDAVLRECGRRNQKRESKRENRHRAKSKSHRLLQLSHSAIVGPQDFIELF